jgi:hypothetical protein
MSTLNTWDTIAPTNAAQIAAQLGQLDRTGTSQEDRIAVVTMMSSKIEWEHKSRWDTSGSDSAPWHMVGCATRGWNAFGDLLRGDGFLGCLTRCLDLGGSGNAHFNVAHPKWDATPAEIIESVRAGITEGMEDGFTIDEDDEAILDLPPAIIAAVHLRMEARFIDMLREQPDLIVGGSIEGIQRDLQKRWRKVVEAIVVSRRKDAEAASA